MMRKVVEEFANIMEQVLQENDHKGGWNKMTVDELINRLDQELNELKCELYNGWGFDSERIKREAADVANFAMFIYDRFGRI